MADNIYTGSCHCKAIKFTIPSSTPISISRCNCTICGKAGFSGLILDESNLTLISPASVDQLACYHPNNNPKNNRYFCSTCGAHFVVKGSYEYNGQSYDHFSVNAALLDQPQKSLDLSTIKIKYIDGLTDNFMAGYSDTPASGGLA